MYIADTLSRAYLQSKLSDADRELVEDLDATVHSVIASFPASQNKLAELRSATETDQVLSALRPCIRDGIRHRYNHRLKKFSSRLQKFTTSMDCSF